MVILGALLGLILGMLLLVLLRLMAPALFPPQGGLHSQYYIGLLPSNPDGTFSRGDYWRMAGLALAAAVACLLLWVAVALMLSAFAPPRLVMERFSGGALFALGLLAAMSFAAALMQISRALRWRPRRLACGWAPDEATESRARE
jgi:hypothetical protein